MIDEVNDSLEDGSVVFGVGVDIAFEGGISFCSKHILLNIHHFFKHIVNICLCVLDRIKNFVRTSQPT